MGEDVDAGAGADGVVEFDDVAGAHSDAAVAGWCADGVFLRGAVDVDVSVVGLAVLGLEAFEPQDAGDDGVATWGIDGEDFTGELSGFEYTS